MTDAELNDKFSRLVDAQLRFQSQLGDLARLFRDKAEHQDRRLDHLDERVDRLAESVERLEMLLENWVRRQYPLNHGPT
ncbi:MAG: hypothetical protein Q6M54_02120 [Thermostichus sp. DRC_bins_24]